MIPYFDGRTSARNRLRVVVGKCPPSQGSGVFGTVDGFGAAMREKCAQSPGIRQSANRQPGSYIPKSPKTNKIVNLSLCTKHCTKPWLLYTAFSYFGLQRVGVS